MNKTELFLFRLIIEPNFEALTSNGTVAIDIVRDLKVRGVKPISVDVNEIKIISVDVTNGVTGEKISYESYYGNDNTSFHVLLTETVDHIANFTVALGFVSQLTETLQGFYRGAYIDEKQKES
jgi:aminopeptidase N